MKKRIIAYTCSLLVSLPSMAIYAENPFSDVSTSSWAYQSVEQLANDGIINGYPDGTFKGEKDITRYEMAQMVAKAMANQDRANAEQQAMINRLADEFSNELESLGVRVAALEDRVGNVKIRGDVRLQYLGKNGIDNIDADHSFRNRARLIMEAKVNPKTTFVTRFTTGNFEIGDGERTKDFTFDLAYIKHDISKNTSINVGRYTQRLGDGLIYSSNFDGIGITQKIGKVNVNAAYGYMTAGRFSKASRGDNGEMGVINISGPINKNLKLGAMYAHADRMNVRMGNGLRNNDFGSIYGVNGEYTTGKLTIDGEWVRASGMSNSTVWNMGVSWGQYKISKKNSWRVSLDYFDQGVNAPVFKKQKYESMDLQSSRYDGYKAWQASASYAPEKNVGLNLFYGFKAKTQSGQKVNNYIRTDVMFTF